MNPDGTLAILFDDGDKEPSAKPEHVKLVGGGLYRSFLYSPSVEPVGTEKCHRFYGPVASPRGARR